jgi:hypothetical protein
VNVAASGMGAKPVEPVISPAADHEFVVHP